MAPQGNDHQFKQAKTTASATTAAIPVVFSVPLSTLGGFVARRRGGAVVTGSEENSNSLSEAWTKPSSWIPVGPSPANSESYSLLINNKATY